MKKASLFIGLIIAYAISTQAATIASWGFEVNVPSPVTATSISGLAPDVGSGSASALHASVSSFTTPFGNGSQHSLSANTWTVGDYWQFQVSTLGFQNIQLSFDQAAAGNGATNFNLLVSTDGLNFTTAFSNLGVPQNSTGFGGGGGVWNATTPFSSYTRSLNLSSFTQLNNANNVYFRLQSNIPGPGTSMIDNFTVTGLAVPEPASIAFLGTGMLFFFVNRRLRK